MYAILVATPTDDQSESAFGKPTPYQLFLEALKTSKTKSCSDFLLTTDVWKFALPLDTGCFCTIVSVAQQYQIPHKVLYFERPPVEYSFSPPVHT